MNIKPAMGNSMPDMGQPQQEGYPDAAEMPELRAGGAFGGDQGGADNPVLKAIRTLSMYVAAANSKQDPAAPQLGESLKSFVEGMLKGGAQAPMAAPTEGPGMAGGEPGAIPPPGVGDASAVAPAAPAPGPAPMAPAGPGNMAFDPFTAPDEPMPSKKNVKKSKPTQILF